MLIICQQRFLFNFFYVFYFYFLIKNAFLTFFYSWGQRFFTSIVQVGLQRNKRPNTDIVRPGRCVTCDVTLADTVTPSYSATISSRTRGVAELSRFNDSMQMLFTALLSFRTLTRMITPELTFLINRHLRIVGLSTWVKSIISSCQCLRQS